MRQLPSFVVPFPSWVLLRSPELSAVNGSVIRIEIFCLSHAAIFRYYDVCSGTHYSETSDVTIFDQKIVNIAQHCEKTKNLWTKWRKNIKFLKTPLITCDESK